ncbi:MAG: hypothetical protein H0X38_10375 [Planctomycetes bacterium]|nr:hypothetical protein [Planctomycetota bacterium]
MPIRHLMSGLIIGLLAGCGSDPSNTEKPAGTPGDGASGVIRGSGPHSAATGAGMPLALKAFGIALGGNVYAREWAGISSQLTRQSFSWSNEKSRMTHYLTSPQGYVRVHDYIVASMADDIVRTRAPDLKRKSEFTDAMTLDSPEDLMVIPTDGMRMLVDRFTEYKYVRQHGGRHDEINSDTIIIGFDPASGQIRRITITMTGNPDSVGFAEFQAEAQSLLSEISGGQTAGWAYEISDDTKKTIVSSRQMGPGDFDSALADVKRSSVDAAKDHKFQLVPDPSAPAVCVLFLFNLSPGERCAPFLNLVLMSNVGSQELDRAKGEQVKAELRAQAAEMADRALGGNPGNASAK